MEPPVGTLGSKENHLPKSPLRVTHWALGGVRSHHPITWRFPDWNHHRIPKEFLFGTMELIANASFGSDESAPGPIPWDNFGCASKEGGMSSGSHGCFLKWWYQQNHPKMIIFSRKTHGFVGETQHFRKPPHQIAPQQTSAKNPPASPVGGSSHGFSSLRDLSLQRSRGHKLAKVIHPPPSNRNAVPVDILQWQLLNRFLTKSTCFVVDFLSHWKIQALIIFQTKILENSQQNLTKIQAGDILFHGCFKYPYYGVDDHPLPGKPWVTMVTIQ